MSKLPRFQWGGRLYAKLGENVDWGERVVASSLGGELHFLVFGAAGGLGGREAKGKRSVLLRG